MQAELQVRKCNNAAIEEKGSTRAILAFVGRVRCVPLHQVSDGQGPACQNRVYYVLKRASKNEVWPQRVY